MDTAFICSACLFQEGSSVLSHDQTVVKMVIVQIHSSLCTVVHGTSTCEFIFRCISACSQNQYIVYLRRGDIIIGYEDVLLGFCFS